MRMKSTTAERMPFISVHQAIKSAQLTDIQERVDILYALKKEHIESAIVGRNRYTGNNVECKKGDTYTYNANIEYMVISTLLAMTIEAIPPIMWMGLDDDGMENSKYVGLMWLEWLVKDQTAINLYNAALDYATCGAGYMALNFMDDEREINYMEFKDGKSTAKKGKKRTYYGPKTNYIPFENVYMSGRTLSESTEVVIMNSMSYLEFEAMYKDVYKLGDKELEAIKFSLETRNPTNEDEIVYLETDKVALIEYYNTLDNTFAITANEIIITPKQVKDMAINPYPHMQVPLVEMVYAPNNTHANGTSPLSLIQDDIRVYNTAMDMCMRIAELSYGITTTSGLEDIDVRSDPLLGTILKVRDLDEIQRQNPQYSIQVLQYIMNTALRNITLKVVDFQNQITVSPYETSASVKYRQASAEKRTNTLMKYNLYSFFYRLGMQWLSFMQYQYDFEKVPFSIITPGARVEESMYGTVEVDSAEGGFMTMNASNVQGRFNVFPDVDKVIGPSKEEKTDEIIQMITILGNLKNADGTQYFKADQVAQLAKDTFKYMGLTGVTKLEVSDASVDDAVNNLFGDVGQEGGTIPQVPTGTPNTDLPALGSLSA